MLTSQVTPRRGLPCHVVSQVHEARGDVQEALEQYALLKEKRRRPIRLKSICEFNPNGLSFFALSWHCQ